MNRATVGARPGFGYSFQLPKSRCSCCSHVLSDAPSPMNLHMFPERLQRRVVHLS